jgi:ketosteroid isomerase-like protein
MQSDPEPDPMDWSTVALISAACRQTIVEFAHRLDHREFDAAADCFTLDGVWLRHGERLQGREEILATIGKRSEAVVERHLFTTIDVRVLSAERAKCVSYVTILRGSAQPNSDLVAISQPAGMADFSDDLVLTPRGWRIAERSARQVFVFEATGV